MKFKKGLIFISLLFLVLSSCKDENEEPEIKDRKYVMSINVTGELVVNDHVIGSISTAKDTILNYLIENENLSLFVPDTLYLLKNNVAKVRYSTQRNLIDENPIPFDEFVLKYLETDTMLYIYQNNLTDGFKFTRNSNQVYISGELINVYISNIYLNAHYQFGNIFKQQYGIGKWPTIIKSNDTIQYYNFRFEYR